jgi:hypothetical protein
VFEHGPPAPPPPVRLGNRGPGTKLRRAPNPREALMTLHLIVFWFLLALLIFGAFSAYLWATRPQRPTMLDQHYDTWVRSATDRAAGLPATHSHGTGSTG